jgi:hypothetical protein
MTPQEWWRLIKDAGFDANTTKVLYALSLEPFDSNGTMIPPSVTYDYNIKIAAPPMTFASLAKKTNVKNWDVQRAFSKAATWGWLVNNGKYYRAGNGRYVLWTLAVGDKNG